jgi:D-3-phosphoglycerate dehydrogenase
MAQGKFKVAATNAHLLPLTVEREILAEVRAEVIPSRSLTEEEVIEAAQDADAILHAVSPLTPRVLEELKRCLVISNYGIGVDTVDVQAATQEGIISANVPDFCFDEVSDTAMSLILAVTRKVVLLSNSVKRGIWDRSLAFPIHKFRGQTLGLLAFGNIPRTLVPKAKAFGFQIIAYDPHVSQQVADPYGVKMVDLPTLLKESDILSIHAPLTPKTHHIIGEQELRQMKKSAFLINTGRGPVVDGKALYRALKEGWIAGAGLDVLEKEPPDRDDPLLALDNVVFTPHYASYTEEAYLELRTKAAQNVASVLRGEWPKYFVNPEVKGKDRMSKVFPAKT